MLANSSMETVPVVIESIPEKISGNFNFAMSTVMMIIAVMLH